MPTLTSAQNKIHDLQAQITLLKETATKELLEKRTQLSQELHLVDAEIARLTGKSLAEPAKRHTRAAVVGKTPSLQELKELLSVVPGRMLDLRREGLNGKHIKSLAATNPELLRMGGKGAWPNVTLVK